MPFRQGLNNVYNAIKNTVEDYGRLICQRADEITRSDRITSDIQKSIIKARLLVADLTDRNPNVFYELGLAHALNKRVILLTQNSDDVPFDLQEIRCIRYDPANLTELRRELTKYVKETVPTIPEDWNRDFCPSSWNGGYIKIIALQAPTVVAEGQPFEIYVKAKNNGRDVKQGYFSVSFPDGIEELSIESNAYTQIGRRGNFWSGQTYILEYPIAEGFKYDKDGTGEKNQIWSAGQVYHIKIRAYKKGKGLLWFYLNASCEGNNIRDWVWDPLEFLLDTDQRDENVYCGVIDVI
jgi:hypothetical protein